MGQSLMGVSQNGSVIPFQGKLKLKWTPEGQPPFCLGLRISRQGSFREPGVLMLGKVVDSKSTIRLQRVILGVAPLGVPSIDLQVG